MMKYFNSIKAIKRDGNIKIICAWFRDKHQKNHIVQFVKELKKFLFIKCPNVFALTGEDIYGEENFGNNIQEELENATHTTANVFYDSYNTFEKESSYVCNIINLDNIELNYFSNILSSSLFTYFNIYIAEKYTNVDEIKSILKSSRTFEEAERKLLMGGILLISRLEGTSVIIKCIDNIANDVLYYLKKMTY